MKSEYFLFNSIVILGPLIVPYVYSRALIPKKKSTIMALGIVGSIFVVWDMLVTGYFWHFNEKYTLGVNIGSIPFEELLFFLTVPYACLFTYVNLRSFLTDIGRHAYDNDHYILELASKVVLLLCFFAGLYGFFMSIYYFVIACWALCISIIIDIYGTKTRNLYKIYMWLFLIIVLLLTSIFNMYLTARPVVIYNPSYILNIRIGTIPIEDFLYSLSLMVGIVAIYEYFSRK